MDSLLIYKENVFIREVPRGGNTAEDEQRLRGMVLNKMVLQPSRLVNCLSDSSKHTTMYAITIHISCQAKYICYFKYKIAINQFYFDYMNSIFKGIVSRDFGGLQMILMNRTWVPDVPLEVYSFLNFCFHFHIFTSV